MQTKIEPNTVNVDDDEIDLRLQLAKLWHSRKLILGGALVIAALALSFNEFFSGYKSESFLRVSGLNPVNYKRLQPMILNADRFQAFAAETHIDDQAAKSLALLLDSPEVFAKTATMVYSTTPKDAKDYVLDKDNSASFLGMQIATRSSSPEAAKNLNTTIAEYFVDSLMMADLRDWISSKAVDHEQQALTLKNQVIDVTRKIVESQQKLEALKGIVKRYPDTARMEVRQVLSLEKGGDRFMSPMAQIVAVESFVVDAQQELITLKRKQRQLDLAYDFYNGAFTSLDKTQSGKQLFASLLASKNDVLKKILPADEVAVETVNSISLDLESRRKIYFQEFRFISSPSLPTQKERKSRLLVLVGAGVGGFFFMVIFSLLLGWWRQNRAFLTAPHRELDTIG